MSEWLARLALYAYPREIRRTKGPEMLGMMLDISGESRLSFTRELASLVLFGLRERTLVAAGVGTRRIVSDSCGIAVAILLSLTAFGTAWRLDAVLTSGQPTTDLFVVAIWVSLALLLMGYIRAVGVIGVVLLAPIIIVEMLSKGGGLANEIDPLAQVGVLLACCVVMATTPGARRRRPTRVLWLVTIFLLGIAFGAPRLIHLSGPAGTGLQSLSLEEAILLVFTLVGLLRLAYDPRIVLGCGLIWAMYALNNAYHVSRGFGQTNWLEVWIAALFLALGALRLGLMRRRVGLTPPTDRE
jgi:hypothetical protein